MSIIDRLRALVRTLPGRGNSPATSAYSHVYEAVVSRLQRTGVRVGGTSFYPRVEVHTISEQARLDKAGCVRSLTMTVETVHNSSLEEADVINRENLALLTSDLPIAIDGGRIFGIVPDQLQDMTETSDTNKIIYRLLQSFTVWVEMQPASDNV